MMSRNTPIVIQLKKRTAPGAAPPATEGAEPGHGGAGANEAEADAAYNPLGEPPPAPPSPEEAPPPPGRPPASPSPGRSSARGSLAGRDGQSIGGSPARRAAPELAAVLCAFREVPSLLDVASLAELVSGLHGEVDSFVRRESEKLAEQEAQHKQAQKSFQEVFSEVRGFVDEFIVALEAGTAAAEGGAGE